jgi:hypothetical protein
LSFDDGDPQARDAVRAMGADAIPTLLRLVGANNSPLKEALARILAKQSVVKVDVLSDRTIESKGMAIFGFRALGPAAKPAVPALIKLLGDKDSNVRDAAAICLGMIGPAAAEAVPTLLCGFSNLDDGGSIRFDTGVFALARMGPAAHVAIPFLEFKVSTNHASNVYSELAEMALIQIGKRPIAPLIEKLADPSDSIEWKYAADVLGWCGTNAVAAIPNLLSSLQQTNAPNQNRALIALGQIHMRPEACLPVLLSFLSSTNAGSRLFAIGAIRGFATDCKPAIPQLVSQFQAENEYLTRMQFIRLFGDLGVDAKSAVPTLITQWQKAPKSGLGKASALALRRIDPEAAARSSAQITTANR